VKPATWPASIITNVVTEHEIGELDGRLFIVMQYLPGGRLEGRLTREIAQH
jgi:hypothetical protein